MRRLAALSLACALAGAAPATGDTGQKTELVNAAGQVVDLMVLRHDFGDVWIIDNRNVLWRDSGRDYYLVTLEAECPQLEARRPFQFHPQAPWRLESRRSYEIRPQAGPKCDVDRIAQVDDARGETLRASALRRGWR